MYYLKKILQHYLFSDSTIAITILFMGIGTNILCYASQSAPMPHVYLFCMIAIFFYYTTQWNHTPTIKNSLLIGLTSGLISLIRPSDIIIVLLFALYGVTGLKDLRSRAAFLRKNFYDRTDNFFCLSSLASSIYLLENCNRPFYILFLQQ
ncbi:MAG: hypothetical protein IPL24_12445 [Bacteroidetes bacterium]|nr:hypothetical protein [Bacteroidota bacterium]